MNNLEIIDELINLYESRRNSDEIERIIKRIENNGTYKDIYEYIRELGLGNVFQGYIDSNGIVKDSKQLTNAFVDVLKLYEHDINSMCDDVQQRLNKLMGINIRTQESKFDYGYIKKIIEEALSNDDYLVEGKISNLVQFILDYSVELTDDIIKNNADIQSKSGFNIVVIRRYDDVGIHNYANYSEKRKTSHPAEVCKYCKGLEGEYDYDKLKGSSDVWKRHKGCSCSIDFVNKGISSRVKNYKRDIKA